MLPAASLRHAHATHKYPGYPQPVDNPWKAGTSDYPPGTAGTHPTNIADSGSLIITASDSTSGSGRSQSINKDKPDRQAYRKAPFVRTSQGCRTPEPARLRAFHLRRITRWKNKEISIPEPGPLRLSTARLSRSPLRPSPPPARPQRRAKGKPLVQPLLSAARTALKGLCARNPNVKHQASGSRITSQNANSFARFDLFLSHRAFWGLTGPRQPAVVVREKL